MSTKQALRYYLLHEGMSPSRSSCVTKAFDFNIQSKPLTHSLSNYVLNVYSVLVTGDIRGKAEKILALVETNSKQNQ